MKSLLILTFPFTILSLALPSPQSLLLPTSQGLTPITSPVFPCDNTSTNVEDPSIVITTISNFAVLDNAQLVLKSLKDFLGLLPGNFTKWEPMWIGNGHAEMWPVPNKTDSPPVPIITHEMASLCMGVVEEYYVNLTADQRKEGYWNVYVGQTLIANGTLWKDNIPPFRSGDVYRA